MINQKRHKYIKMGKFMAIDFHISDKDLVNMHKRVQGVTDVIIHRNDLNDEKMAVILQHFKDQEIRKLHIFSNVVGPRTTPLIKSFLERNVPGNLSELTLWKCRLTSQLMSDILNHIITNRCFLKKLGLI